MRLIRRVTVELDGTAEGDDPLEPTMYAAFPCTNVANGAGVVMRSHRPDFSNTRGLSAAVGWRTRTRWYVLCGVLRIRIPAELRWVFL